MNQRMHKIKKNQKATSHKLHVYPYFYPILSPQEMRKLMLLLGMYLLATSLATANDLEKQKLKKRYADANHFSTSGTGFAAVSFRDRLSSPRVYGGPAFSTFTSYERHSPAKIIVIDAMVQLGVTLDGSPEWGQNSAVAFGFRNTAAWLFPIPFQTDRWHLYAGPALQSYAMFRVNNAFGNSAVQYDVSNNIGLRTRFEYGIPFRTDTEFSWWIFRVRKAEERKLRLGAEFDVALAGLQSRPPFAGVLDGTGNAPVVDVVDDFFNNTRGAVLGQFIYVTSRFYAQYPLRNGNRLQFSYHLHGFGYDYNDQMVRTASSSVLFSYMFRFDKNKDIR